MQGKVALKYVKPVQYHLHKHCDGIYRDGAVYQELAATRFLMQGEPARNNWIHAEKRRMVSRKFVPATDGQREDCAYIRTIVKLRNPNEEM